MFSFTFRGIGLLLLLSWWTFGYYAIGGTASGPCSGPEARQFDFWIGEWNVLNKLLQEDGTYAPAGRSTAKIYPALDGCLIIEHWQGWFRGNPLYGFSMRAWNEEARHWDLILNWPGPGRPSFGLMTGVFTHGRGEFFSHFTDNQGNPVSQRYTFSDARGDTLRWDAARSSDRQNWRTNWIMEFTRRSSMDRALANGPSIQGGPNLCPDEKFRSFDFLIGEWHGRTSPAGQADAQAGSTQDGNAQEIDSSNAPGGNSQGGDMAAEDGGVRESVHSYPIVRNCAILDYVDRADGSKQLRIRSYLPNRQRWVAYQFDTGERRFQRLEGTPEDGRIQIESENRRIVWITSDPAKPVREVYTRDGEEWILSSRLAYTPKP